MTQQLFDEIADGLPPSTIDVGRIMRRERRVRAARRATGLAAGVIALAGVLATGLTIDGGPAPRGEAPAVTAMSAPQFLLAAAASVETRQVDMPRSDQWIYTKSVSGAPGEQNRELEYWSRADGSQSASIDARGRLYLMPGGLEGDDRSPAQLQRDAQSLPMDPKALLKRIYQRTGEPAGSKRNKKAFTQIVGLLTGPIIVPPKVDAALFRALALIPDVRMTQDVVDIAGRHGVGISRADTADGIREELILDGKSFAYLGHRLIVENADKFGATAPLGTNPVQEAKRAKLRDPQPEPTFHRGDVVSAQALLATSVVSEAGQRP